jgi:hypothetical protein
MEKTSNHQKSERRSVKNKQNSEKESSGVAIGAIVRDTSK